MQRIWNDPVWSKVISGMILGAGALLLAVVYPNPDPVVLGVLSLAVLVGFLLLFWSIIRPPVAWRFAGFLGMVGGGGDLRVVSFQANGRNRSGKGIHKIQGHLISNIDNSTSNQLQFVIGGTPVPPSSTTGIPPGANFQIVIPLCDLTQGYEGYLKEYDFLHRWGSFRFVAELDGYNYEKNFTKRKVVSCIEAFRRTANPLPQPEVRLKSK